MFLRRKCRYKDGKSHFYWSLVETYRTSSGPRQRTVAYLGDMDEAGRLGVKDAAEGHDGQQGEIFGSAEPEWVEVNIRRVRAERCRRFGDAWMALEIMKKLGLPELFEVLIPKTHEKIRWSTLGQVLIVSRFCEASSELFIAEQFYRQSALADLFGVSEGDIYDNRLYRALDKLVEQKDKIQEHLKDRLGTLFDLKYDILLYDVTSTYFEGEAEANLKAARGYSRDNRPDCKQVCIGLVVTKEGFPFGYEIFEGNKHDSKTVETIIEKMESLYGKSDRIWIMDRGMVSPDNLELLSSEGRRYIIGTPKAQLRKFEKELLSGDWRKVHDGVEVKLCPSPEGTTEVFILCRSTDRQKKEEAIHNRFVTRIEEGLKRLQKSCTDGRVKKVCIVERRIGRLLERNQRAASLFDIEVKELDGVVKIAWTVKNNLSDWSRISEGCYLLRSNVTDWQPEDLWKAYIQLTKAEEAFRLQKHDLELRPVWHQLERRVNAHILVCFIAYVLWKTFGRMCRNAGLGDEPRKVIQLLKAMTLVDVILPTRKGIDIRLQCVSKPDRDLAWMLQKLQLIPPERLTKEYKL